MESCFCVVAAAVFMCTVAWTLRRGCDAGYWLAVFGALEASLYFAASPVCSGAAFLCCSLALLCVAARGAETLPPQGRAVLVTGCDSGFGHALALRLGQMGVRVFAGVLDMNGEGARRLRERGGENLQVLQLDVTDGSQIERANLHIRNQVGDAGLWGLVNNAGILHCLMDAELLPVTVYSRCMEVNFLSAVKMCQVFLPLLRRSRGRIVNVSSVGGEVPFPMFAAYGASKAALSMFSKVLRLELSVWGVRVMSIQPTGFKTNIFSNSDTIGSFQDEIFTDVSSDAREDYGEAYISSLSGSCLRVARQLPEDLSPVVDNMCHALLSVRPRPLYTPGQMGWLLPFLQRHFPTALIDRLMSSQKHTERRPARLHVNSGN